MEPVPTYVRRHLRIGWWSLLVFLSLGIALEVMHGFKLGYYLSAANETRRLMWTLAHAHGVLLSVVHVVFAGTLKIGAAAEAGWVPSASKLLTAAGVLLPSGFFLGGMVVYGGDPFVGVLLVPIGALCLLAAVFVTARNAG